MKRALFLGCTVPVRARNYEMAARQTAALLGIEFIDIPGFTCCGFPVKSNAYTFSQMMSLRNLALAEEKDLEIVVLCSACTSMLAEANHKFRKSAQYRDHVNALLRKINRSYSGTVRIKHFSRMLLEDVGIDTLRKHITFDLGNISLMPHYGCHYLKPSEIHGEFDSPEDPKTLDMLIEVTGAKTVDMMGRKHCCGGALLASDNRLTYRLAAEKLHMASTSNADALCLVCPFCGVVYDDNQKLIENELEQIYQIPVLYYPQILGLAFGLDPKHLGFKLNKVKTKTFLSKLYGDMADE
ncbi:CoB--CoM heterodisulfide reductase iron-sulfur subunit B family protein [bacterium]|nr:CoB--CoM heterodisulfide reductase iron-sulfur subunit B family protein [candidate division CSSED10-310 bacterium]